MWAPISISNTLITVFGYPLSYIEFAGTITGLFSVWFAAKANIWTWPTGLINVACFFLIFFEIHLYADMFLQVYFFIASLYGWVIWHNKTEHGSIKVLPDKKRIWLLITIILSTLILGLLVKNIHLILPSLFTKPASYPFPDTFVAVLSIIATILLAQRMLENWVLWIMADIISIVLYAKKGVLFISIEYVIFLCLASSGLAVWVKLFRNEKRSAIGKFMPLHAGHVALIQFALGHCDELIVLVCATDRELISGAQRVAWVSETFKDEPAVKPVLLAYDESVLPNTSESSEAVSKLWGDYLLTYLPPIDIVFASEPYAEYLAGFLNCGFKMFDTTRGIVPVSSTKIRENPYSYWNFIPPAVRSFYVKKICLYGTESTGKTIMTQRLAGYFNTAGVAEMAREILENTYECTEQHLMQIAELHASAINQKLKEANQLLFVDTDINITRSYSKFLFEKELNVPDWVETANKFDLYLYLDNDAPYVQDGTRLSISDRERLNEYHSAELTSRHIDFKLLSGDWDAKFKQAIAIVETRLLK